MNELSSDEMLQEEAVPPSKTSMWVGLFVLVAIAAGFVSLQMSGRKAEEQRAAAVLAAEPKIRAMFPTWQATRVEDGVQWQWSGMDAQVIYINRLCSTATCEDQLPQWHVWAKSAAGTYFIVAYALDDDLNLYVENFERRSAESLLQLLDYEGEHELIRSLGLAVKPI